MSTAKPQGHGIDLAKTPIHLSTLAGKGFELLADFHFDGPSFESYVEEKCTVEDPGCIVMIEESPESWGSWECHPKGDELVIVLEGKGTFFQEVDGAPVAIRFQPGATIHNKQGVWHTADVEQPMRAIYITTCPETDHKPRD